MATAASVDETLARFAPNFTAQASYSRLSPADISLGGSAVVGALNEGPLGIDPVTGAVIDSSGVPIAAVTPEPIAIPLNNFSLQAALTIPLLDYALRLMPARRGAEAETQSVVLQREAEKLSVELEARIAFFDWARALAQIAVVEQTLASVEARLSDARIAVSAGTATQTDIARLEEAVSNATLAVIQAQSFRDLAGYRLQVLTGEASLPDFLGEDIFAGTSPRAEQEAVATLVAEARDRRLELRALLETSEALRQGKKAARAAYYPRLDGFVDGSYANPNQRFFPLENVWRGNWTAGVTASWQLQTFLQARSQSKTIDANQRRLRANIAALERAIGLEVTAAYEERRRAVAALELNATTLRAAELVYEQQAILFAAGDLTTTDLIAAETDRLNASLRQLNAGIDLQVAEAKITRATGRGEPIEVPADRDDAPFEQVGLFPKRGRP
jgi:outer membrane protein TolC